MLYMNYPRCRNCAFSANFVRECTDVSLSGVAGEGVELTVHKESVVVEEIKKVELRPRGEHLFMTEIKSNWATRSCTWQTSGEEVCFYFLGEKTGEARAPPAPRLATALHVPWLA